MFDFIFSILAQPVRFIAFLVAMSRIANPLALLRLAWDLGRDPQDAANIITITSAMHGIEAARDSARAMFDKTLDASIMASLAWREVQQGGNVRQARKWYDLAVENGVINLESLLPLKLFLSTHYNEFDKAATLEEILARNDLPMEFTRAAMLDKAAMLLKQKQWDEASEIADRVLAVEDHPHATWIKWVVTLAANEGSATTLQALVEKQAPPGYAPLLLALGYLYTGNRAEAIIQLKRKNDLDNLEFFDKDLAELARSADFWAASTENRP
jgi:hypothetical protein